MENGLHGQLGLVVLLSVGEAPKPELEIALSQSHQLVAIIVLGPILNLKHVMMNHAHMVRVKIHFWTIKGMLKQLCQRNSKENSFNGEILIKLGKRNFV